MRKLLALSALAAVMGVAASNEYRVIKEIKIGGEGGWDYVTLDAAARRLYVSHATRVAVVDVDAGNIVGEIPDTQGVHGIAVAPGLNRGFTSNGRSNTVTVFDLKTLQTISQVKTGENPDSILFEPNSGRVFTFNGRSKDSTAFDAATGNVAGTIPLGGKPEFSVADSNGRIYVNIEDTSEIAEIDAKKLSVNKRYSLKPCESPSGLAIDQKNRRLFSVCENRIMAISDPDTAKVLQTVPIGQGADGAGFDPGTGMAFSSNGDGTLTIVRQASGKWEVAENLATPRGARTMAVDTKTHKLYLPTADLGPPAAGVQTARPRPTILPNTFKIVVVGN